MTLIGAVVGGIVFGALSDRYGRVRVLTWTIVLFAVFTGLCAIAQGYWDLLVYRTIAGIGLGGEFGIGMALAIEAWPAKHRAKAASYVALGWQVGVLAAALLTPVLLPHIGWRGMFVVGIFPHLWLGIYEYAYMNLKFSHENRPHFLPKNIQTGIFQTLSEGQCNHKSEPWCSSVNFRTKLRLLRHYDLDAKLLI